MEQLTLTLKSEIQPAVMTFNFQEIQTILDARLDLYRNLVVTEDSLQGSKNAKKELVSFRNRLMELSATPILEASSACVILCSFIKSCNRCCGVLGRYRCSISKPPLSFS